MENVIIRSAFENKVLNSLLDLAKEKVGIELQDFDEDNLDSLTMEEVTKVITDRIQTILEMENEDEDANENGKYSINSATLTPAYGRDYLTKEAVVEAFLSGKDFRAHFPTGSTYCSIRDFKSCSKAKIRFNGQTEIIFVPVP